MCLGIGVTRGVVINDSLISIKRAPEPTDIIWENCNVSKCTRFNNLTRSGFITLLLLGLSFLIIFLINIEQRKVNDVPPEIKKERRATSLIIGFFSSLAITILNGMLILAIK
jgi:hypothetical protein